LPISTEGDFEVVGHSPFDSGRGKRTATRGGTTAEKAGRTRRDANRSGARLKIQVDMAGGSRLGPGKVRLLELIKAEGSLSRAAAAMGISYRRAWLFVQQLNAAFDEEAIATPDHGRGGGAARLTDFGEDLIRQYRRLESFARAEGSEVLRWLERHRRAD
jgi:molybdate transport system regulatory protein